DPDKPEITAFHHHSQARDLITNDRRWLSRNTIRTQSNNKLRMEDWAGQEGIKLSTEHSGKSQLNLGYLVNQKLEHRGEGFELRTSGWGVIRAGKGVMVTTYDRPGANGAQRDMQETIAQLESALELAKVLANSASSAKAEPADTDAQQQMKDDFDGLQEPALLMSTPASVGMIAGHGVQFAAKGNINVVAGKNADFSVMKHFTVAAGELISMFAQKLGIKIFAGKGPVEIQAQSDAMSLLADQDVSVSSVNGTVRISAKNELILECGGGFIQLKDGNITLDGPEDLFFKVITIQKQGAASMNSPLPQFPVAPNTNLFSQRLDVSPLLGKEFSLPFQHVPYVVKDSTGRIVDSGMLSDIGKTSRTFTEQATTLKYHIGNDPWRLFLDSTHGKIDDEPLQ
ncbi:DUF2345 domain-containing protein, partial [Caballeronia sp. LZ024]|uniref:DUF2345 domain-containing protein n=2 Tax=unclassified Caballeronia TaxID=2646786 RepID=UPI0028674446